MTAAQARQERCEAVVIGCSAGGLNALKSLLSALHAGFPGVVLITFHIAPGRSHMQELLSDHCRLPIHDAEDKLPATPGHVYLSCPDYHLLVEDDRTLSLNIDPKVCNVRPSIDLLFESAAAVYRQRLVGVILTGANQDGAQGLKRVRRMGGHAIVQDPVDAEVSTMPQAAIETAGADDILPLDQIGGRLNELFEQSRVRA